MYHYPRLTPHSGNTGQPFLFTMQDVTPTFLFVSDPLVSQRRDSPAGAQATVKCNPWFAIIVSGRSSRLAESPVIHPLSYECHRIRSAVFLAKTATYCCSAFAHRRVIHDRVDSVTDRLNGQPLLWYWRRPNSEALDLLPP